MPTSHTIAPYTGTCIYCGLCLLDEDLKAMSGGVYYWDGRTLSWPGLVEGETAGDCRGKGEQLKMEL